MSYKPRHYLLHYSDFKEDSVRTAKKSLNLLQNLHKALLTALMKGFLYFVLSKNTNLASSPTSADLRIKYPSRRRILLLSSDMAELTAPLDINTQYTTSMSLRSTYSALLDRRRKFFIEKHKLKELRV